MYYRPVTRERVLCGNVTLIYKLTINNTETTRQYPGGSAMFLLQPSQSPRAIPEAKKPTRFRKHEAPESEEPGAEARESDESEGQESETEKQVQ